MKRKRNTGAALFFAMIVIVLASIFWFTPKSGENFASYSAFSTGKDGASLLYDTLLAMDYPVAVHTLPTTSNSPRNDVVIMIAPNDAYFSKADLDAAMAWVGLGGRLMLFGDDAAASVARDYIEHEPFDAEKTIARFYYGQGEVALGSEADVENDNLKDNAAPGAAVCRVLDEWKPPRILFDETIHGYRQSPSFFRILPAGIKFAVYQLALVAIAAVWFLGKRFGRPVPYYEELEREQNEGIKALAAIYRNAGKGDIIVESLYESFLADCADAWGLGLSEVRENLMSHWRRHNLPYEKELAKARQMAAPGEKRKPSRRFGGKAVLYAAKTFHKCGKAIQK